MYHQTDTCVRDTHVHTQTRVVVILVFPLAALLHMHEAQAMCEAAHCQAWVERARTLWKGALLHVSVCQPLLLDTTVYLSA